jgi:F-type H+-transporting ATPase subunit epsilon
VVAPTLEYDPRGWVFSGSPLPLEEPPLAELNVELVAADRKIWSGTATMVVTRTVDGELGILPGHVPVLGVLETGPVRIKGSDGETIVAAVHGGFLSVAHNVVSILAEVAELADEIDVARAEAALEQARTAGDDADVHAEKRAETRLRAAGRIG